MLQDPPQNAPVPLPDLDQLQTTLPLIPDPGVGDPEVAGVVGDGRIGKTRRSLGVLGVVAELGGGVLRHEGVLSEGLPQPPEVLFPVTLLEGGVRSEPRSILQETVDSGVEAAAVMPTERQASSGAQSSCDGSDTSWTDGQPHARATSASRLALDENASPATMIASTPMAMRFRAPWRLVVA